MSQDLFDSDPDDPGLKLTPLEFSGVSGASSSSPSQHTPVTTMTVPSIPQPARSVIPSPRVWHCKVAKCKKKSYAYKTWRNYKNHMADKHNELVEDIGETSQETTASTTSGPTQVAGAYVCSECQAQLQSKKGYLTHRASHRMKEANKRKPTAAQFKDEAMLPTVAAVVEEILAELAFDDSKAKMLQEFKEKTATPEWNEFCVGLVDFICNLACEKQTKLLPMNQYEVAQAKLNSFLNCQREKLQEKFLAVVCDNVNKFHTNRLIFRFASKLLSHIQMWVVKQMRCTVDESITTDSGDMSEIEEKNFAKDLGLFLRKRFKRYRGTSDVYCSCIKETFVDGQHPISSYDFLNEKNWFSGEEKCIEPSDHSLQFFKSIELIIRSNNNIVTAQEIIEIIFVRSDLLDHWFYLTNAYISEQDSLLFMRDLLIYYLRMSLLLEEKRLNRGEDDAIQASASALRTHLQRNYVAKDVDVDESVE